MTKILIGSQVVNHSTGQRGPVVSRVGANLYGRDATGNRFLATHAARRPRTTYIRVIDDLGPVTDWLPARKVRDGFTVEHPVFQGCVLKSEDVEVRT